MGGKESGRGKKPQGKRQDRTRGASTLRQGQTALTRAPGVTGLEPYHTRSQDKGAREREIKNLVEKEVRQP